MLLKLFKNLLDIYLYFFQKKEHDNVIYDLYFYQNLHAS